MKTQDSLKLADSVSPPDLDAGISAATPSRKAVSEGDFYFGPYYLNLHKRRLYCNHAEVNLTRNEYLLLRILAMNRGATVSRRQVMQSVWGTATMTHGALESLVNCVRLKLKDDKSGLIASVSGVGYSLTDAPAMERLFPGKPAARPRGSRIKRQDASTV